MADTIREQIIQAFITRAAAILVSGGYQTDIGENVERAISEISPSECPALVVWPATETNERKYGRDNLTTSIRLEGFVVHGSENSSAVSEKILGDLRKCFTDPSIKTTAYGTLIEDISYASGGTETYAKPGELVTGCGITVSIRYSTLTGDPYNQ